MTVDHNLQKAKEAAQHATDELDRIGKGGQLDDERLELIVDDLAVARTLVQRARVTLSD